MILHRELLANRNCEKTPVSARKAQANRQNALKSTGPKTARGKAYSRRNALKHGLFAQTLFTNFCGRRENPQEFRELVHRLRLEHKPLGTTEELEVERIATCWWRLKRAWRYEDAEILLAQANVAIRELRAISNIHGIMFPKDQAITLLLERAEKEIEANGEISAELHEKIFATEPLFRTLWPEFQKVVNLDCERVVGGLDAARSSPVFRKFMSESPNTQAEHATVVALATIRLAKTYIELWNIRQAESVFNVEYDLHAIPGKDALDKLLRYESAIERELNRSLDRLERLQRRRRGEQIPPPLSLHVTG